MLFAALDFGNRQGGQHGPRFIFPLLLLLLISFLLARVIRHRRGGGLGHHHRPGSPLQTLEERFARGDIEQSEFAHRKAVLEGAEVVPPAPKPQPPAPPAPADDESSTEPDVSQDDV